MQPCILYLDPYTPECVSGPRILGVHPYTPIPYPYTNDLNLHNLIPKCVTVACIFIGLNPNSYMPMVNFISQQPGMEPLDAYCMLLHT